mgnify:CR=1 FL=1
MKGFILLVSLFVVSVSAQADRFIQFSDGSTAWQNENGHVYGKTPSANSGFDRDDSSARQPITDTRGTLYTPAAGGYINTQTGRFVPGQ